MVRLEPPVNISVFQVMDPEEGQHSVCPVATLEARECDPRETGK
jgi:hypothetical protein